MNKEFNPYQGKGEEERRERESGRDGGRGERGGRSRSLWVMGKEEWVRRQGKPYMMKDR